MMPLSASKMVLLLTLPAVMLTAACKKDNKEEEVIVDEYTVPEVQIELSLTSLSPSSVEPGTPEDAVLYGAGFEDGASVTLNGIPVSPASVRSGNVIDLTLPGLDLGSYDLEVTNPDGTSATLRSALSVAQAEVRCEESVVRFAYNSDEISSSAASGMMANLSCYKDSGANIRIEGYTDERGTVDYNLALGQRRANATRRWLESKGVSNARISVTSYGKEDPVDPGHSEAAWSKNRRAEIKPQN